MKRILSIHLLAIATLFIIALSAIPHHHHKEALCIVMELCKQDNTYNDVHTDHSTDPDDHRHSPCVSNVDYISTSGITKSHLDNENGIFLHLPVWILSGGTLTPDIHTPELETIYDGYDVSQTSVALGESSGLRAPPQLFS